MVDNGFVPQNENAVTFTAISVKALVVSQVAGKLTKTQNSTGSCLGQFMFMLNVYWGLKLCSEMQRSSISIYLESYK